MKGTVGKYEPADGIGHIHPDDARGDVKLENGPKGPEAVEVHRLDADVEQVEDTE